MTAKEYLRSIRTLDDEVGAISEAMDNLRAKIEGVKSPTMSDMPKGGKGVSLADGVAKLVDLQREWGESADRLVDQKRLAKEQVGLLSDSRHRRVLTMYYLAGMTFEKIAVTLERDYTTICRWHGSALQEFENKHKVFLECHRMP